MLSVISLYPSIALYVPDSCDQFDQKKKTRLLGCLEVLSPLPDQANYRTEPLCSWSYNRTATGNENL